MKTDKSNQSIKTLVVLYFFLFVSAALLIYTAIMVHSITYEQTVNYNNHFRYHLANGITTIISAIILRTTVSGKAPIC